jgi:hypothetical protein
MKTHFGPEWPMPGWIMPDVVVEMLLGEGHP